MFHSLTMDSSNIDSRSKATAFNKFKRVLYKYCLGFQRSSELVNI